MDSISLKAMAKINLGLDVVRRREDGYHEVRMIMQNVYLYDTLRIEKCEQEGIHIKTNIGFLPTDENNLVYKAAGLLMDKYECSGGLLINLSKHIPVAAGMAGGSTDAASALYGVNRLFELGLSKKELMEIGVKIGADVPYCIMRGTALSEGIGEVLTRLPAAPNCKVLIAKPSVSVSTKYVYTNLKLDNSTVHPDIDGMIEAIRTNNLYGVADKMGNVLESVTEAEYPVISEIKKFMKDNGALNSLMSGSGPTVFGIFDDDEKAEYCCDRLKEKGLAKQVFLTHFFNIA